MEGWIKIWRKFMYWGWYTDLYVKAVFIHLLINANHKEGNWLGVTIKRGQYITSIDHLAHELRLSSQQIRTALNKLKSTNEITSQATNKYTIITICNYEDYQDTTTDYQQAEQQANQQTNNKQITNEQQTNNKPSTTNKNEKNDKNEKNVINSLGRFSPPTIDEVKLYCEERKNNVDAERFIDFYSSKNWMIGKNKMKDWKAAVRTWEKSEKSAAKQVKYQEDLNVNRFWGK